MLEKILKSSKTILTIFVFIILFGTFSYINLPREADPDISLPVIYVSIFHQGISPKDSERLLVKTLEKELKNIEGIKKMSSTSYLNGGNIVLEFDAGFKSVHGFLRKQIAENIKIRCIPSLQFFYDESVDEGSHIERLISEMKR